MRFACDTGGTFTDLIVEDDDGGLRMYKAPTTPADPLQGILDTLIRAANDEGEPLATFLARADMFIHGTTYAVNAIVTGETARTAFLTTKGHPDILVLREGGRLEPFNFTVPYPEPYIPRALTFEVPERVSSAGEIYEPLDEDAVLATIAELRCREAEAVAVCFLWSIRNPAHERRVGELLDKHLPNVPYTLSHQLNPVLREYRRASATAIDASLKPLMTSYLGSLTERLQAAGFRGRTLTLTSQGGMLDTAELAEAPIHAINSGPSTAPVAGRHFASVDSDAEDAIVADAGGTTYDVSLVRRGRIPVTDETWIGEPFRGHMTGFSSIDVRSIGAGGGSIAWMDDGGVLHVGPRSAGAVPGPVCYGFGGLEPTVTDAALVLGYLDPDNFLGGTMTLDRRAAEAMIRERIASALGWSLETAATAILDVATESMVQAIADITVSQGIDPATSVLVGGGGAAGLNALPIARRLRCPRVIIPAVGAALSAAGALRSDLSMKYRATLFTTSDGFDQDGVNRVLQSLAERCQRFIDGPGSGSLSHRIEYATEARYAHQVWEIPVPLQATRFSSDDDLNRLVEDFHSMHEDIFAIRDPGSAIEMVGWNALVSCELQHGHHQELRQSGSATEFIEHRAVYFRSAGAIDVAVYQPEAMEVGTVYAGPAIIESPFTTIVADPESTFQRTATGSLILEP